MSAVGSKLWRHSNSVASLTMQQEPHESAKGIPNESSGYPQRLCGISYWVTVHSAFTELLDFNAVLALRVCQCECCKSTVEAQRMQKKHRQLPIKMLWKLCSIAMITLRIVWKRHEVPMSSKISHFLFWSCGPLLNLTTLCKCSESAV
jgi:hypothetical protein